MKPNWMKIGGIVLTIAGGVVSVCTKVMDDKKLDDTISKKVAEALAEKK
jgi:hypothetical protein